MLMNLFITHPVQYTITILLLLPTLLIPVMVISSRKRDFINVSALVGLVVIGHNAIVRTKSFNDTIIMIASFNAVLAMACARAEFDVLMVSAALNAFLATALYYGTLHFIQNSNLLRSVDSAFGEIFESIKI